MENISINIDNLKKSNLTLLEYLFLMLIHEEEHTTVEKLCDFFIIPNWETILEKLVAKSLIINTDGKYYTRAAGDLIFKDFESQEEVKDASFEEFWDKYHNVTKLPKTDRVPANKYWDKLSKKDKKTAIDNIENYYNSLNNKKYCKKARTYLSDKNYNDEFVKNDIEQSSTFLG